MMFGGNVVNKTKKLCRFCQWFWALNFNIHTDLTWIQQATCTVFQGKKQLNCERKARTLESEKPAYHNLSLIKM